MAVKLTSTREAAKHNGVKSVVYSIAGGGKTSLAKTFDVPTVIISCEAGLLSLADTDIPVIEVKSMNDMFEAYNLLSNTPEGKRFEAVVIDSVSEIAEVLLAEEKKSSKDARAAYGNTSERMMDLLRAFRDLNGRHVLFICKLEKVKDEMTGAFMYGPSMPGQRLGQAVPYLVDEVFALRVERNEDGQTVRYLQTTPDTQWQAKDRSGRLAAFELPDMAAVISKITGVAASEINPQQAPAAPAAQPVPQPAAATESLAA